MGERYLRGKKASGPAGEGRESLLTLKAMMRMMPGMEAIRMSQRHPMVGMTTEARPMMSREPASQKTWAERREGSQRLLATLHCPRTGWESPGRLFRSYSLHHFHCQDEMDTRLLHDSVGFL